MSTLLAVDLGIRTGLALFDEDGRVKSYQSRNFGTAGRLRQAVRGILHELPNVTWLVVEGGGPIAEIWQREAVRCGIRVLQIAAEQWRNELFYSRDHRSGPQAKRNAGLMARRVIDWSHAARPTSLRHDAAEAILIGMWGVLHVGWLDRLPPELQR